MMNKQCKAWHIQLTSCDGGVTKEVVALAWMASITSSKPIPFLLRPALSLNACNALTVSKRPQTGIAMRYTTTSNIASFSQNARFPMTCLRNLQDFSHIPVHKVQKLVHNSRFVFPDALQQVAQCHVRTCLPFRLCAGLSNARLSLLCTIDSSTCFITRASDGIRSSSFGVDMFVRIEIRVSIYAEFFQMG